MKRKSRSQAKPSPTATSPGEARARAVEAADSARRPWADAWVGLEPTFSDAAAVRMWERLSDLPGGADAYFESKFMRRKLHVVARGIVRRYRTLLRRGDPACLFDSCVLEFDRDPWDVERAKLRFVTRRDGGEFQVRFGMDPETFEFSIKPTPLAWFYQPRFVRFLQEFVWDVPRRHGLHASMAHGGGQFSFSARDFLGGSLLADEIASRLDHPELATWILDYPNADDRSFRATERRKRAFESSLEQYWAGAFHPQALGELRAEHALFDRGFGPAAIPAPERMDPSRGPRGDARTIFQTNFAFGRSLRWTAQNVDAGYWQAADGREDGYRPDQIMRYSEANLNRLQIAGERHVKSGRVLDADRVPALDAPLDSSMLYDEASFEQRAQMSKTSAQDMADAVLLEAHHAQWLAEHPHVRVRATLAQDRLLADAEATLARKAPNLLDKLRVRARAANWEDSGGRVRSDRVEPETLFWAAWSVLSSGERAEIAREAIGGFSERVENAASKDPRGAAGDPMEPHRHRVHPQLWRALEEDHDLAAQCADVARELRAWQSARATYRARRPKWSVTGARAPWKRRFSSR